MSLYQTALAWPRTPVAALGGPLSLDRDAPYFLEANGALFRWRGLTAFLLLKRFLTGRAADAYAYMDWAASQGINVLRVFSQVDWDPPAKPGVEQGFYPSDFPDYNAVVHQMFHDAAARSLRIELVAHTFAYDVTQMLAHSRRIDDLVHVHGNAVFEDANEPPVNHIPLDQLVGGFTPRSLASSGMYDPNPYPGRSWVNDHPPRDNEFCRKFKGAWEFWEGSGPYEVFSPPWKKPVVMDEPDRIEHQGTPDDWQAFAAGCALFCSGATIHGGDWAQRCFVPTDAELLRRIAAFLAGLSVVPLQRYYDYQHPPDQGSLRRYRRRGEDGAWYEISVRPYAFARV